MFFYADWICVHLCCVRILTFLFGMTLLCGWPILTSCMWGPWEITGWLRQLPSCQILMLSPICRSSTTDNFLSHHLATFQMFFGWCINIFSNKNIECWKKGDFDFYLVNIPLPLVCPFLWLLLDHVRQIILTLFSPVGMGLSFWSSLIPHNRTHLPTVCQKDKHFCNLSLPLTLYYTMTDMRDEGNGYNTAPLVILRAFYLGMIEVEHRYHL